jgi:hypothetical protein
MTKITFKPWEEIVIHETIKRNLKDLVKLKTLYLKRGQVSEFLLWAEGVVFVRTPMPNSEDVIRDQLKGIVHYSSIEFAEMPEYRKTIVSEGITVPIVDVSDTPALREVAKELRRL